MRNIHKQMNIQNKLHFVRFNGFQSVERVNNDDL